MPSILPRFPSWVVLHVPHDSTVVPDDVRPQFLVDDEALQRELVRMTDHLTYELFAAEPGDATVVRAPVSRLVVDVERFADDAEEPMAERGMGVIYTRGSDGAPLRRSLSEAEREALLSEWYHPHHARLEVAVDRALALHGRCLVIDCHSFPSVALPYEHAAPDTIRPQVCIGTDAFHTDARISDAFVSAFGAAGWMVARDVPFSGALVPASRYRRDPRVSAVMVEIDRGLYVDEVDGTALPCFDEVALRVRDACREALRRAHAALHPTGTSDPRPAPGQGVIDPASFDRSPGQALFGPSLCADVDRAVADAHAGHTDSPSAVRLASAFGICDDEDGPWHFPDLFDRFLDHWAVELSSMSVHVDDDQLLDTWSDTIDGPAAITDSVRAKFVRYTAASSHLDVSVAVIAIPLRAADGRGAVLGCTGAQQGNVGFKVQWRGVHPDVEGLRAALEGDGIVRQECLEQWADKALVEWWSR